MPAWEDLLPTFLVPLGAVYGVVAWVWRIDPLDRWLEGPLVSVCTDSLQRLSGPKPRLKFNIVLLCCSTDHIEIDSDNAPVLKMVCDEDMKMSVVPRTSNVEVTAVTEGTAELKVCPGFNSADPIIVCVELKKSNNRRFQLTSRLPVKVTRLSGPFRLDTVSHGVPLSFLIHYYAGSIASLVGLAVVTCSVSVSLVLAFHGDIWVTIAAYFAAASSAFAITAIPRMWRRLRRASASLEEVEAHDVG